MNKSVQFLMSIFRKILLVCIVFLIPLTTKAAATQFTSPNYGVESVIFGGTGLLHSTYASIPPKITVGPTVTNITTTGVTVNWTTDKPANALVMVNLTSVSDGGSYAQETGQLSDTTQTVHAINVNGLTRGTTYYYRVRSNDVAGNVVESAEYTFTTNPGDIWPPKIINGPVVTINSATSVTITWETDEISNSIVEYGLQTVTENSVGYFDELTIMHSVTLNNLISAKTYLYRIKSQDASGNLYTGPTINFNTPNAPSITDVRISDVTLNSALVQWNTTSPSNSVINYGPSQSYGQLNQDLATYTTNHIVRLSGLSSGTTYYLQITGQDQDGNKIGSDQYLFKTVVLPLITNFTVSNITSSSVNLAWQSTSDIDELVQYVVTGSIDKTVVGKEGSAGTEILSSTHNYQITDLYSSSTYQVSVMGKDVFGNQAISGTLIFSTQKDTTPPVIENVKTDTSVNLGGNQTVQVLVSFGLSKPGTAYIEYGIGATGSYTDSVKTDTDTSPNKFMVIQNLQPGQSYHFRIVAKDLAGNIARSADYLVLAPTQPISLFDLIFGQIQSNFGWMGKL
jgi:hypothetical protein